MRSFLRQQVPKTIGQFPLHAPQGDVMKHELPLNDAPACNVGECIHEGGVLLRC